METNVETVSSCPEYINTFIQHNLTKLIEIYDDGMRENREGCLGLHCNQSTNKMDVMFMNLHTIAQQMTQESWTQLYDSIPEGKRLFLVKDEEMNAIFLLYI